MRWVKTRRLHRRRPPRRPRLLAAPALVALLAPAVALLKLTRVTVTGESMRPTLEPGDRLLVSRGRSAQRGDVVVVREPGGLEVVKRLAGRSGDVVDLGQGPVRLGAGEVAVLGDRRQASTDSRRWGPLPAGAVRGRLLAVYHPPERARVWRRRAPT